MAVLKVALKHSKRTSVLEKEGGLCCFETSEIFSLEKFVAMHACIHVAGDVAFSCVPCCYIYSQVFLYNFFLFLLIYGGLGFGVEDVDWVFGVGVFC